MREICAERKKAEWVGYHVDQVAGSEESAAATTGMTELRNLRLENRKRRNERHDTHRRKTSNWKGVTATRRAVPAWR